MGEAIKHLERELEQAKKSAKYSNDRHQKVQKELDDTKRDYIHLKDQHAIALALIARLQAQLKLEGFDKERKPVDLKALGGYLERRKAHKSKG